MHPSDKLGFGIMIGGLLLIGVPYLLFRIFGDSYLIALLFIISRNVAAPAASTAGISTLAAATTDVAADAAETFPGTNTAAGTHAVSLKTVKPVDSANKAVNLDRFILSFIRRRLVP